MNSMNTSSQVIGVLGASGGLGASVLTCAIAVRAAAAGLSALAVDGDRFGGGLDVTMGLEQQTGLRWPDLARVRGEVDGDQLLSRLPWGETVPVLSFDRSRDVELSAEPVRGVISGLRAACEVVSVDLPAPGAPLFGCWVEACADVVLLAGSDPRGLAAACAVAPHVCHDSRRTWLCVRVDRHFGDLAPVIAEGVDLPLSTVLRHERGLDADLWHGLAPGDRRGPVAGAADELLAQLVTGASGMVA
jgi:secretion/DNA translocation related CpaE-like protein